MPKLPVLDYQRPSTAPAMPAGLLVIAWVLIGFGVLSVPGMFIRIGLPRFALSPVALLGIIGWGLLRRRPVCLVLTQVIFGLAQVAVLLGWVVALSVFVAIMVLWLEGQADRHDLVWCAIAGGLSISGGVAFGALHTVQCIITQPDVEALF
jgi:hypothetical protein